MATDAKKHTSLAAGEKPTRAALAASLLSINDVIPVANVTEANQVAAAVAAAGQNLATNPVVVARADARGLHRIEYSYNGTVWLPASGILSFASKSAADTWAASNSTLLSNGDQAQIPNAALEWNGTKWIGAAPASVTFTGIYSSSGTSPVQILISRGRVYLEGLVVSSSATFATGSIYTIAAAGGIPAAFRPPVARGFIVQAMAVYAQLTVVADGSIIFSISAGFTGPLSMPLDGIDWRAV